MASGAIVVDLKGCGCMVKKPNLEYARSYWIGDFSWTPDDLFLVCITKRGSLTILSRLGEPLVLQSEGRSVEHGPQYYLPFHPLITIVPNKPSSSSSGAPRDDQPSPTSSLKSEADEKRQRFCVSTHPTKPMILCSDGYLATIMELPESLTCTSLMTDFLSEGRTALNLLSERQQLGLTRLGTLKFQQTIHPSPQVKLPVSPLAASGLQGANSTSKGLISTVGSDANYAGPYANLDEGKIVFGYPMELDATQRGGTLNRTEGGNVLAVTSRAQRALFSTLGLGLSHSGTWTSKLDHLLLLTASSIVRLCEVIILHSYSDVIRSRDKSQSLQRVCSLFQDAMATFLWDMTSRTSQPTALKMSHWMVSALLHHTKALPSCLAQKTSVVILQFSERLLSTVYTMVPVQQPSFHIKELMFHDGDVVEGAHFASVTGKQAPPMGHIYTYVDGQRSGYNGYGLMPTQVAKVPVRCLLGKRLIKSWKLLHDHLNKQYSKLLQHGLDSTTTHRGGNRTNLRRQRQLLLLLCGVQKKLHHLGWNVPLSFSQFWVEEIHKGFLKGCEWYINGYVREAIQCWHLTTLQAQTYHTTNTTPPSTTTSSSSTTQEQRHLSGTPLLTASLVAILYTHLENYDLSSALKLIDRLIHCYQGDGKVKGHRSKKGVPSKLVRTDLSFLETIRKSGKVHFTAVLPCVPLGEHRAVVACLARWMALYFTNQPLYIYPACSAVLMPSLIQGENTEYGTTSDQPRTLPLYHDRISGAIRHQDLSEVWTADTALALFLVCGLVPEAVWLARELGDWKSAFTLAVLYSEQNSWVIQLPSSVDTKPLVLPGHLTPDAIMKESLSSLLQTSGETPLKSKNERRGSMDSSSSNLSILQVPTSGGLKKSSSMYSIHDEDKASQEQRSKSLTDMLTAAALIGLDPTLWLLGNLTDACLSLVAEFNTLVPDDFYLPAPPYYCPQPEYIPKEGEAEQVLNEARIRHQINDVIQGILLVLNSSHCSLPCAKWYVQRLGGFLHKEGKRKKGTTPQLPKALAAHSKYQLDLLEGFSKTDHLPASLSKLLMCFRNLCTIAWLLHVRDKLSTAIRKYQTKRERSLRVKAEDPAELVQHKMLLFSIIEWASCVHPFMKYLQMEDEIQDILLTAISELPANKQTVTILAKHFHNGEDGLYPAVQEKFGRLMEKLKRKREVMDKKQRKHEKEEEKKEEGKGKTVKYESLHRYYKRQCQRRKVELNNRKDNYGSFEEHIFDPEQVTENIYGTQTDKPSTSKGGGMTDSERDSTKKASNKMAEVSSSMKAQIVEYHEPYHEGEEDPVSPRQAAHSHPKQKKFTRMLSFSQDDDSYPIIGSREFESNASYLDFLETFFLVAFGKIAQNLSPSSKPDAPLLGMFSERLKKQELNPLVSKMLGRQKSKIELDISGTLRLPSEQSVDISPTSLDMDDSDMDEDESNSDGIVDKMVPRKGLFCVLGRRTDESDRVLNETIYGQVFSKHGYRMTTPTSTPRKRPSEDMQLTGTFLHNETSKPYTNVRLNLGKKYQKHVDLLQWLARWTERQQRALLNYGGGEQASKAVLRVQLPQQLMLNTLWLLENCYYPELFQHDMLQSQSAVAIAPSSHESTSASTSQRVHFDDGDGRRKSPHDVGKRKVSGSRKDGKPLIVQAMLKPSSSSEDLIDGKDEVASKEETDDLVAKMRKLLLKKTKSKKKLKDADIQDNAASADGGKVQSSESRKKSKKSKSVDLGENASLVGKSKVQRSESRKRSKKSNSVGFGLNEKDASIDGSSAQLQEVKVQRSESRRKGRKDKDEQLETDDTDTSRETTQRESQEGSRPDDKSTKKRKLPVVTSDHLSTAVDYKTEARKARERLRSPARTPSLRSSPQDLSQRSATNRDDVVAGSEVILGSKVTGEDAPDGRQSSGDKRGKVRKPSSDSSSLNVSSLDEEEVDALHRDLTGPSSGMAGPSALSLKSSPTDVRKMVQDEFRKMMGKSIMEVLGSTNTPPDNQKPKPNTAAVITTNSATNAHHQSHPTDSSGFLHPQTQSVHGVHHAGTQAGPQLLLQTWHGQESMLHHQSLRQTKPGQFRNEKHVSNERYRENDSSQMPDEPGDVYYSELRNPQGSQGHHSNVGLPSNSSGHETQPLTLQDLDYIPSNGNKNLEMHAPETRTSSASPHIRDTSLQQRHGVDVNNLPHHQDMGNRNNNANQNHHTSQNGGQAQNGWHDEDEYDTIPTRDSDEFVPSNSTSSHHDDDAAAATENDPPPAPQTSRDNIRQRPPPEYHNTFAFAQPGAPPPLLMLNQDGSHRHQLHGPPPPPPQGFFPFSPRQGWAERADDNLHASAPPHVTLHQDRPSFEQRQGSKGYRNNLFLPQIPLLTLDHRRPTYQPQPPSGSTPRVPPMPLLTLDPRPSHHLHQPPQYQQSNFPYMPPAQSQTDPNYHMEPPAPMPLLRLDGPPQPYLFKSSRGGVGTVQLIPPDEIIAFEQKKHREKMERLRQQQETAGVAADQQQVVNEGHMPLLHLDSDEDDDTDPTRHRRRRKQKDTSKASILPTEPASSSQRAPPSRTKTKRGQRVESTTTATSDDERTVVERGRRRRRGSKGKPIVMLVDKEEEDEEEKEQYQTAVHIPKDEKAEDEVEEEEKEDGTQPPTSAVIHHQHTVSSAPHHGQNDGYAIKPGTYDSMLANQDNHLPYQPTSAEIHLNVVKKLQEPPKRQDASMMTMQQRDVSTSMDNNGLPLDPAMRFGAPANPVSQYTTAATGVSDTGHIIAPDIFFGLRFGNKPDRQPVVTEQTVPNKDTTKRASDNGRDFISVVDIDSDAITELLHQPEITSTHRPTEPDRDSEMGQRAVDSSTGPEPSVAELHYNARFHRDAHPEALSPLSSQQMADDQAGADPVTTRLLDTTPKPAHSLKAIKNRSQSARDQSKQRVYQRLAEMAEQLDAIDEVSKHMDDDFKNTKLMLNTVEQLTDTMASSQSRPKPDSSGPKPDYMVSSEPPRTHRHEPVDAVRQDGRHGDGERRQSEMDEDEGGEREDKKLRVTIKDEKEEQEDEIPERGPTDDTEDVLGITGLSGVSDIIAEALADEDTEGLGLSQDTKHKLQAKRANKQQESTDLQLDTLDLTTLSRDQLREIFTPRSQLTTDEDEDEDLVPSYAKKPSERSEAQRQELKEWMAKRQAKNLEEYKKKREDLAEREPKPYQPPKNAQIQLGSTQKDIKRAERAREGQKRTTDEEHFQERAKAARQLMAEIFAETPALPPEPEPQIRTSQQASKPDQTVTKPKGRQRAPPRGGGTRQGVLKGTYLFIDSEVYPPASSSMRSRTPGADRQTGRQSSYSRGRPGVEEYKTGRESSSRFVDEDQRVPPIQLDYSSDDDYDGMDAISERTETNKENEPVRDYRPPRSYKQIVRVQRPEVTRGRGQHHVNRKRHGEMLKELKQETSRPGSSGGIREKQRLYGSKRVPGTYKGYQRKSPRAPKPYTQRLAEMKDKSQTPSRLRARPRSKRPQFGTATVTVDPGTRRQQIEGRGLRAEVTPRTSTPYTERLGLLSTSETYRRREDVVSPAPKVGLPYKPKTGQGASTYVDRLKDTSAGAPRPKHKTAYVGALGNTYKSPPMGATYKSPPMGATYKSPQLHTPSPRLRPYRVPSQEEQDVHPWRDDDELSGISDVSPWSVSDDVKRLLQKDSRESLARGYTTDEDFDALDTLDDQDDYLASVDVRELEEIASIGSESISNIDWAAVDQMIADVR
ncbi:uncharacterized protein [Amphiura filiformis]|uniref:uncharacterized protein n=1 Tax=Amphiura filiformis TaxID=82378 RepID=UPI003B20DE08